MCDCEGLRDDRRADIIQLWEKKKKKKHVLRVEKHSLKPIRIQLECPYNSSNETKNTHVWVFTFLYSLHKQYTFLYISTYVHEAARNVLLVLYNSA